MKKDDAHTLLLQKIDASLDELLKLTRISYYPLVKQTLETVLDTEEKRLVYHLLDGNRTVAEIQQLSGVNARYISEWGREWEKIGIVQDSDNSGRKGRRQNSFDISTFGIIIPETVDGADNANRDL